MKTQALLLMAAMSVLPLNAQTPAPTEPATAPAAADFSEHSRRAFSMRLGFECGFVAQNIPEGMCDAETFASAVMALLEQPDELKMPEPLSEELTDKLQATLAYQSWERGMRAHREGEDFLKKMAGQPGVQSLPCGVLYRVNKLGEGEKYSAEAHGAHPVVHMRYSISSISGCKLSDFTDEPVDYVMGDSVCIAGIDALLPHLPTGTSCTAYIPADLAFGAQEISDAAMCVTLPGNSVVVIDMVVEGFEKNDTQTRQPIPAPPFSRWKEPEPKPVPLTKEEETRVIGVCTARAAMLYREVEEDLVEGFLMPEAFRMGLVRALGPGASPVPPLPREVMLDYSHAKRHQPKSFEGKAGVNPQTGEIEIFSMDGEKVGNITPGQNGGINVNIEEKEEQEDKGKTE